MNQSGNAKVAEKSTVVGTVVNDIRSSITKLETMVESLTSSFKEVLDEVPPPEIATATDRDAVSSVPLAADLEAINYRLRCLYSAFCELQSRIAV